MFRRSLRKLTIRFNVAKICRENRISRRAMLILNPHVTTQVQSMAVVPGECLEISHIVRTIRPTIIVR